MTLMALPFGVGPVGARASVCPSLAVQVLTSLNFVMILTMQDCRRFLVSVHCLYAIPIVHKSSECLGPGTCSKESDE